MAGLWYFIEKNGRNVWSYKRLQSAVARFELVCSHSFKDHDVVRLVREDGVILREF